VEKCTFCVHRVDKGLEPACVANCPAHVLHFGDLDDPNSEVSQHLAEKRWFRLLEEHDTHPRVYYLGGIPPSHHQRPYLKALQGERSSK
jgi:Fe-S-cluster-containing dehydrogenase component